MSNLPAYRLDLAPIIRGLEIGLAHGYFLIGPFTKLGPLRNYDVALLAGFMSTIGLITILTLGLTIYGEAVFDESTIQEKKSLQTKNCWNQFKSGFFIGGCCSSGFALLCLSNIPSF